MPHLLLLALFLLTLGHLVTLKLCSTRLDHRTTPIFISAWVLAGQAFLFPFYGHLLGEGMEKFLTQPLLLGVAVVKGVVLYFLFITSQKLMQVSLSSRHYVTPLSLGLMTLVNHAFGEELLPPQLFAALGLCALAMLFFFKGHLSDLGREGRRIYALLVGISVCLSAVDHVVTRDINWYALLFVSNSVLLALSLARHGADKNLLKTAFFNKTAIVAGLFYAATELVKFYQQVSINPVSVVVTVQAMTKPIVLVLGALIWKERTVREQLLWGVAAFVVTLPLFVPEDVWKKLGGIVTQIF